MDEAATNNLHCLCYKYKDHAEAAWTAPDATGGYIHAKIPSVGTIPADITLGGTLVVAKNGKC